MPSIESVTVSIHSVTLEVPDPTAAEAFYTAAFGLGDKVRVRASHSPATGFRGFTLSLVVSQPSTVDSLISTALAGGATTLKPAKTAFCSSSDKAAHACGSSSVGALP